jgi:hypothetical protein
MKTILSKNKKHLRSLLLHAALLGTVFTGCATIFTGSSETIGITSEPGEAKVYVNGSYMGESPVSVSLKRDHDYNIMVKKEGYHTASSIVRRSFNPVAILNLLNPICWLVDVLTGALWVFEQDHINLDLEPLKPNPPHTSLPAGKAAPGKNMQLLTFKGKTIIAPSD